MKIYHKLWNEIEQKDWPYAREVYVCMDPQKRLGEITWSASRMGDGTSENDTTPLGLFWDVNMAILFAESVVQEDIRKKCAAHQD